ncbi:AraC family transcriptional regulator [Flavobacteriaceae bacterium]|nr:AraC family transcriptional regulator [Flavobacteriaceae bacterium]
MISILLTIIVGAFCFFIIIINFVEKKNNKLFNNYMNSILIIAGLVRLVPLLGFILTEWDYESIMKTTKISIIFLIPLFFLNLKALVSSPKTKSYVHLIIPILLIISSIIFQSISKLKVGIFIIAYSSIYIIMIVVLVVKFLRKIPENIIELLFKKKIKNWITVLMCFSIYLYLITLYSIYNFIFYQNLFEFINAYGFTSIGYLIILTYIIFNRNLLLGKYTAANYKEFGLLLWSISPQKKIEKKDSAFYEKLMHEELINDIINWQKDFKPTLDEKFNYGVICDKLNVPLYKVKLIFKYHTTLSLTEFLNTLRIFNALNLIDEGYLNSFTIESLGKKVGFNSRITFSNNFKRCIGLSVRKYINQIDPQL